MRNVSAEFLATIERRRNFEYHIECTLTDGTVLQISNDDIWVTGSSISEGVQSSSFAIGNAMAKTLTLSIENGDDRYDEYDFFGAVFNVSVSLELDSGTTEFVPFGKFTVITPETYGSTITITAIDDMYKADCTYERTVSLPCTIADIFRDACRCAKLSFVEPTFDNYNYQVTTIPEQYTCRQIIGWCAMMCFGNAKINRFNSVEVFSYSLDVLAGYDGGTFKYDGKTGWGSQEAKLDGGNFIDYSSGDEADGGAFTDDLNYHTFVNIIDLTLPTDNIKITGVQTVADVPTGKDGTESKTFLAGEEGYVMNLENPLFSDYQDAVDRIYQIAKVVEVRPFEIFAISNPTIEVGDACLLTDRKGNYYPSLVTDVLFEIGGGITVKCSADSPIRNNRAYNSDSANALIKARELAKVEQTDRERAITEMSSLMANSFGFFTTDEIQQSGGTIRYVHNKPKLSDSDIRWKITELGFQVSKDYGQTWEAGITADGKAVVSILSAVGINADWINAGTITGRAINGGTINGATITSVGSNGQNTVIQGGTLTTNNARITGGSIAISTQSSSTDIIELNSSDGSSTGITSSGISTSSGGYRAAYGASGYQVYSPSSETSYLTPTMLGLNGKRYTELVSPSDLSSYATKSELSGYATQSELSGYATQSDLAGKANATHTHKGTEVIFTAAPWADETLRDVLLGLRDRIKTLEDKIK